MSGRNRMSRHADGYRGYHDDPRPLMNRGLGHLSVHPAALEEEFAMKHREMQRIIAENRLVIDDNTLLQRELTDAKDEIHRLGQVLPKLRAEKEAQSRELIERGLKLEADLRATEPIKAEVIPLRAEVQKLSALRQELSSQVQGLTQEITRLQAENQQLIPMRADIDGMRNELVETRRAYEYERKASEEQVEQKQAMENNLVSMAREIEKLRAEQLNAGRRARERGGGGYGMMNGSPDMRYSRGSYGNGYSSGWGPYDKRGSRR
ncbi:protein FLX-like 3 [Prunus dulcis]|nr:protein FLX-like 3 [Prunus dulcis]